MPIRRGLIGLLGAVRRIWRRLAPLPLRTAAGRATAQLVFESTVQTLSARKVSTGTGPPSLVGFFSRASGVGRSAQLASGALDRLGIPHRCIDMDDISEVSQLCVASASAWLFYVNPPELMPLLFDWKPATILGPRFGHWAWELPKAPRAWLRAVGAMDGVLAQSAYTAAAFAATGRQISVAPHPMFEDEFANIPRRGAGANDDIFRVVNVFDFGSSVSRKNPLGALAAFNRAFGPNPAVELIFKTHNSHLSPDLARQLHDMAGPNIKVVDDVWDRPRVLKLIASADVLLSLHRAEGFGLTMAEAMMLKVPVVATGWSGNLSFMDEASACLVDYRLVPIEDPQRIYSGQMWAEPDLQAAATHLQRLRADKDFANGLAKAAQKRVASQLSPEAWFATLPEELRAGLLAPQYRQRRPV